MNLLNQLIEQAKNPRGIIGSIMLRIMNSAHTSMNQWALEKVKVKESAVILDIGCGGGKTIQLLSKRNTSGKIVGIDYSEQAVKDSIRANKQDVEKGKVNILQASVTDMPFSNNTFDIITAFQTHYFWPDLEKGVKEAFRVLKKDGHFLIIAELYKINYHMQTYKTREELEQLFIKTGFNSIKFYEQNNAKWLCAEGFKTI
ncbi:class I SAM-dependent methyltransferase [Viridibacillus sp. FSL R5-0477]|uniref:SAM-dependent methyltransferase n=1 Tax=Viridibacillus arenosi FSL R5-213 TaxID=1227360 RepID=W4F1W3_9BACL|nr:MULTISPECIES: class I SAM-dependent methyltransferase [Viridibacillus]ETT86770.1 SAM-dependent methyltransferase [Viridibacillus arenosi FSL R5-213]OMC83423.1 SAM-dependent methyltransferase [Viridibacillus sp. FSL H8-0123]OMC89465.1 SAM-dependent methyltransferase [Viridibacillus arenosi]